MYTNRYKYRKNYTEPQTSIKSKIIVGVAIVLFAILYNMLVETQLYQHIIYALS